MQEGKKQKQIGGLINEELNHIFQKLQLTMFGNGLVSISSVKVTPDLLEARIYLSLYNIANEDEAIATIESKHHEIKKELAKALRFRLKNIPVLKIFKDDTLDHVFKLEELFKKIERERTQNISANDSK